MLCGGVALVFAGLASSLGFSVSAVVASAAAIAALLYAGGVWFGAPATSDTSVVLFTHSFTVASGPHAGRAIADLYPSIPRAEIDDACRRALGGEATRFTSAAGLFSASPVRSADGAVVYGLLLSGPVAAADVTPVS